MLSTGKGVSTLLIFEGEGKLRWFEGSFAGNEERQLHRRGKYKKLALR